MKPVFASMMAFIATTALAAPSAPVRVGSKKFTESVVLGELVTQLASQNGASVKHLRELGGTRVLWAALIRGDIDLYPEYTGTLRQELLSGTDTSTAETLALALAEHGLRMSAPLGFNNTYAIGVLEQRAQQRGWVSLSDLAKVSDVKLGLSHEFVDRADGWPLIRDRYRFQQTRVQGLEHELAYRALQSEAIQATDLYSTDPEIRAYGLRVLADDRQAFPEYQAVFLYRADLPARSPEVLTAIHGLEGKISATQMISLNAQVKLDRVPEAAAASDYLARTVGGTGSRAMRVETRAARIWRTTREHLFLVLVSLISAILVSVPLGVWAARAPRTGQVILSTVGVIQTVPSLALLVVMIPLLGIGDPPAVVALFVYSLLPVVRNTAAGLNEIPMELRDSAVALGLPAWTRLWRIELPLASPSILAGIKTSAVINVGTATLGALIGAGGYGQPILTGIRLDNFGLILEGAVPAAVMALLVQLAFEGIERWIIPRDRLA